MQFVKEIDCETIMSNQYVRRALYKVVQTDEEGKSKSKWIRIMDGDMDCNGPKKCTITYKDKDKDLTSEQNAVLKVDNFEDATHLFDLIGFQCTSYQENLRTKFICALDNVKYILRFDVWPGINEFIFININAKNSATQENINDFINVLGLNSFNVTQEKYNDVDNIYRNKYSIPASEIPRVTFETDFEDLFDSN
jgi:hypothetical protein